MATSDLLFGRSAELEQLRAQTLHALERSSGHLFFITAPPGAGKSALVTAVLDGIAASHDNVAIARGRCLPSFGTGEPYLPFIDALRDLGDESTPGFVRSDALSGLLEELAPYWLSVVPLVGGLLSATLTTTLALSGRTKAREAPTREALFVQYLELLRKLAERAPLILVLEDLHWADHASVALLAHVARAVSHSRMVVIATLRPAENEAVEANLHDLILELERESCASRITLGDLDAAATAEVLAAEFGGDVAEPLLQWMRRTAGGNPLFIIELARLLRQSGGVREHHGEWHLTGTADTIGVPRSAEAVIEKRIQRLDPETIRLLQYASVQGNQFDSAVLAGLLDQDELTVLDSLEGLQRTHQLVQETGELDLPDGDTAVVYNFRHALMQTVLYSQLAAKRRVLLHRKAGGVVETLFARGLDTVAGELAIHYHEGRVAESAYRHARVAADQARRVFGHWEAERFLRIALEHAADGSARADVRERLGDVYENLGHYQRAVEEYEDAHRAEPERPRIHRKICAAQRKAALASAPVLLQRIRTLLAAHTSADEERCRLLIEVTRLPGAVDTEAAALEAVAISEHAGPPSLFSEALSQLAVVRLFAGRTDDALLDLDRALAAADAEGDIILCARCHSIAGVAHARHGRYRDARGRFEELLRVYERIGDPHGIAAGCTNLGALLLRLGDLDAAETFLQRARVLHERRDRANVVQSLLNLAVRARLAGDLKLAGQRFAQMAAHAQEFEDWSAEAVARAGLGLTALELGDVAGARAHAMQAGAAVADRDEWFEDRDVVETMLARIEVLDGSPRAAAERLARAAEALSTRDVYLWARLELERADVLRALDHEGAAGIVNGVITATSGVQSPPLERAIQLQRTLVQSSA